RRSPSSCRAPAIGIAAPATRSGSRGPSPPNPLSHPHSRPHGRGGTMSELPADAERGEELSPAQGVVANERLAVGSEVEGEVVEAADVLTVVEVLHLDVGAQLAERQLPIPAQPRIQPVIRGETLGME